MMLLKRALNSLRSAWGAVRTSFNNLHREYLVEQYLRAGAQFGDAITSMFIGECVDLETARLNWARYERHYAHLGYRTIAPEDFIEYGAHGKAIDHLLRVKRIENEPAVYHADNFDRFEDEGFGPLRDFSATTEEAGTCALNGKAVNPTAGTDDGDCQLERCRLRALKEKQEHSRSWRF
jgi:hypothetical protein